MTLVTLALRTAFSISDGGYTVIISLSGYDKILI